MLNNVVVTYSIKPEAKQEHIKLIEGVFAQLNQENPNDVDYQVMCLEDGVTFVHMSSADTPDGTNPLPKMSAFQKFSKNISERVTSMPNPTSATNVGSYHGRN